MNANTTEPVQLANLPRQRLGSVARALVLTAEQQQQQGKPYGITDTEMQSIAHEWQWSIEPVADVARWLGVPVLQ